MKRKIHSSMGRQKLRNTFYERFIQPRSADPDLRRREYILNVLLAGLNVAAGISLVSGLLNLLTHQLLYSSSLIVVPVFTLVIGSLLWLSRKGYVQLVAVLLLLCIGVFGLYYLLMWSFALPATQLLFVLVIVLSGVLFRARVAVFVSVFVSGLLIGASAAQNAGYLSPNSQWLVHDPEMIDAVGASVIFLLVGLVTWLSNAEIDRALARARTSEASLVEERNTLEVKVKERTKALEEAHLVRLMELHRFAEFGKLFAGLFHDIASPLTAATISVSRLNQDYRSRITRQAIQNLRYIERYFEAARKQLAGKSAVSSFKIKHEIDQVVDILRYVANKHKVVIETDVPASLSLRGDSVKFSQVIANLVLNAIEAYDDAQNVHEKVVRIVAQPRKYGAVITVRDFGRGIEENKKKLIFESFYTDSSDLGRNLGIGLSLVKTIVERDYHGRLTIASSPNAGTIFTVRLHHAKHI